MAGFDDAITSNVGDENVMMQQAAHNHVTDVIDQTVA